MSLRALLARQLGRPSGWAGRFFMAGTLNRVNRRVNAMALERLALSPDDRFLDVGFGGGLLLQAAIDRQVRVDGIEISQPMLERARRRFRAAIAAGRLALHDASVSDMPFPDGTFTKVVTINTMHFWPEPAAGLREIARVLRPGGRFVLAVRPKEYIERIAFTDHGFAVFEDDELHALLGGAGLRDIRIEHCADAEMGIVIVTAAKP